jgi:thiol-disulfide isomerase/thioredoxin
MIEILTPENYFTTLQNEQYLQFVMSYGETCGPCKVTMPYYEAVAAHFIEYGIINVKFYKFHQWQPEYKPFIHAHNLAVPGVPTFRGYFFGEVMWEKTAVFQNADTLKAEFVSVITGIQKTMEFSLT